MSAYPVRLVYCQADAGAATQLLVSVPKRLLHHAVDRNRVKRQVREAYRLLPADVADALQRAGLSLAFVWMDARTHTTETVRAKVQGLCKRLCERLRTDGTEPVA